MEKRVNGNTIEITNIELFDAAFEGMSLNKNITSNVNIGDIEFNLKEVNEYIGVYNKIYRSLPFPLYAIERDIKYAVIGKAIQHRLDRDLDIHIRDGLIIGLNDKISVKFVNKTWAIVKKEEHDEENKNIDLELYSEEVGYKEFKWVLDRLLKDKTLENYYDVMMKDFKEACNHDIDIMKREMANILNFSPVPEKRRFKEGVINDIINGYEYILEIFTTGKVKLGGFDYFISYKDNFNKLLKKNRYINKYDFRLYRKRVDSNSGRYGRLRELDLEGFGSVFESIIRHSSEDRNLSDIYYTGIIYNDDIIFQVDREIYHCKLRKYSKADRISRSSLYSYEDNKVFLEDSINVHSDMFKEAIYYYDIESKELSICRITYKRG